MCDDQPINQSIRQKSLFLLLFSHACYGLFVFTCVGEYNMCACTYIHVSVCFFICLSQMMLLEKALLDEHQYKTGKAALHAELKSLLASQQASLQVNDEVCRGRKPLSYIRRIEHLYKRSRPRERGFANAARRGLVSWRWMLKFGHVICFLRETRHVHRHFFFCIYRLLSQFFIHGKETSSRSYSGGEEKKTPRMMANKYLREFHTYHVSNFQVSTLRNEFRLVVFAHKYPPISLRLQAYMNHRKCCISAVNFRSDNGKKIRATMEHRKMKHSPLFFSSPRESHAQKNVDQIGMNVMIWKFQKKVGVNTKNLEQEQRMQ